MVLERLYDLFLKFRKVETDSRKITDNSLFFALKGENFNGNIFARDALDKGAAFAIVDEVHTPLSPRIIVVDDVLSTLQKLAKLHRDKLGIPVLAITGSNGKTTTKELIAAVLSAKFRVIATKGNLNNHIGVPLTLLQMDEQTDIAVIEMGANHPGEIGELCSIADPDYGLITNIGRAHLEGFGSFEGVKRTKAELYQSIQRTNGTIFLNGDNFTLTELTGNYERCVTYGEKDAFITGEVVEVSPCLSVMIHFQHISLPVKTALTGSYNFENVLAAATVGYYFNIDPATICRSITGYIPKNNRSQLIQKGSLTLVMDAYNANPSSMQVSIDSFVAGFQSPRYVILGDMLELGDESTTEHQKILHLIDSFSFDDVCLVGPVFSQVAKNSGYHTFDHTGELIKYLQEFPITKGSLLVKGSRKMQLENVLILFS